MNHFRPLLTILVLLLILFLVISVSGRRAEAPVLPEPGATTTPITPGSPDVSGTPPSNGERVITYTFRATLPTPCHRLSEPDVIIRESFPEQVVIEYTTLPPPPGTMCAQVITMTQVTDSVVVPESAVLVSVTIDGERADFTIAE